jgi:exodeoxyribonuclease-5
LLEFESPEPQSGDRVICLKNNHIDQIFNGMTGTILSVSKEGEAGRKYYEAEIDLDGEDFPFYGNLCVEQFGQNATLPFDRDRQTNLFDFGYALTVHKAQGSQARRVVVFEERFARMTDDLWKRWLYTAVTRAEEELYIV